MAYRRNERPSARGRLDRDEKMRRVLRNTKKASRSGSLTGPSRRGRSRYNTNRIS